MNALPSTDRAHKEGAKCRFALASRGLRLEYPRVDPQWDTENAVSGKPERGNRPHRICRLSNRPLGVLELTAQPFRRTELKLFEATGAFRDGLALVLRDRRKGDFQYSHHTISPRCLEGSQRGILETVDNRRPGTQLAATKPGAGHPIVDRAPLSQEPPGP